MISVHFQGKPFSITVIQVYAPSSNAEEAEFEWFYEDLQELLEITPQKDVLFNIGDWNAKVGCQEIPGITGKFGLGVQNEAGQKLTEFCQEYQNQIDYILCSQRWRSSIQSGEKRLRADYGSDHEFLIGKLILPLKKVGRNTRQFR